jgi:predicted esterase
VSPRAAAAAERPLSFVHRFVPGAGPEAPTLLLLHGTGGDESDLLGVGRALLPSAALLSPRGKVLENGMPRFFRRFAEGVFDVEDLKRRAHELADFVGEAAGAYGVDRDRVTAVGYSNGANIAAATMLLRPEVLSGAALFRAMVPLVPEQPPDLRGRRVLLAEGEADPIVARTEAERLASLLRDAGAVVTLRWTPAGHGLTQGDLEAAREWLDDSGQRR